MTSGVLKKLHILYWRHSVKEDENARTKELRDELTYDEQMQLRFRTELDYKFMNCNRNTEDYVRHRTEVEALRPHKVRLQPLVYLELWKANKNGYKEEYYPIDSDYRLKLVLRRIQEALDEEY